MNDEASLKRYATGPEPLDLAHYDKGEHTSNFVWCGQPTQELLAVPDLFEFRLSI
jgi:hypothetical protein